MAKNKGKRRSKAAQNKQSSPTKNGSSATTREASPEQADATHAVDQVSSAPTSGSEATSPGTGTIRKVSARVAQFEEAARAGSLLNHERTEPSLESPLRPTENVPVGAGGQAHTQDIRPGVEREEAESPLQAAKVSSDAPSPGEEPASVPLTDTTENVFVARPEPVAALTFNRSPLAQDAALDAEASASPKIPERSIARSVEPEIAQTFEATRQPVMVARPVMLENIDDSRDNVESDVDLDSYFDSPDDVVVTAATMRKIDSPDTSHPQRFAGDEFDMDSATQVVPSDPTEPAGRASDPASSHGSAVAETSPQRIDEQVTPRPAAAPPVGGLRSEKLRASGGVGQHFIRSPEDRAGRIAAQKEGQAETSFVAQSPHSIRAVSSDFKGMEGPSESRDQLTRDALGVIVPSAGAADQNSVSQTATTGSALASAPRLGESFQLPDDMETLPPPPSMSPQSSPNASPRAYKYEQSPLPKLDQRKTEPPIIGVCVVGFHHQRGPEVEYWVGPDESQSTMWPYLPFQSLPDGSHQFEENVTYFMLLYDRNRHAATSLTFDRDEDGHIRQGTTDFRNVTTLFAIACSRQIQTSDLKLSDDEEYTRSTVQKSVVVIASKPLFGPIKEKLTVVTRSYFAQQNFGDRAIIDHFYHNLVQMPLWTNENDLHVGMNLQKCIHDFGAQVLVLFKAMLLETKILFYASDTDVLGTTQFALVSLIPNLINHLEDSGSPLLSSYELDLQQPTHVSSSDRQSLLKYFGLPLQLFAGGGVFSPFVPLQQFDDLKQPETQYGMMGTTNKLFLGTDIDFDVVVNVDTSEVVTRNSDVAPLLQLTDQDKAFISTVQKAVNTAWDTNESWQPQALGYYGGEDYIRHEFEEYLMALLASAKYEQHGEAEHSFASSPLQHYGSAWSDRWMRTNNFRISNRTTDKRLFDLVDPVHPGVKLQKPSGIERFFGIFKSSGAKNAEMPKSSSASVASQTSSAPRTPSLASGEKFGEQSAPTTPSTPRRWFWQSDRSDAAKTEAAKAEVPRADIANADAVKIDAAKPDAAKLNASPQPDYNQGAS